MTTKHLARALDALTTARTELLAFADAHPDRMDNNIASATDMAASARDKIGLKLDEMGGSVPNTDGVL